MKKVLSLLLVAAMALMLVACGGSSSSTPAASGSTAASGSAEAPTGQTLKVMLSEEPSSGDSFTTTLNKWAEETGNSVELMVIPYDDQLTKFPLMAKNKDLPDLVSTTRLSRLYPDEFVDLGQVVDTSSRWHWRSSARNITPTSSPACPCSSPSPTCSTTRTLSRPPAWRSPLWTTAGRWMKCTRPLRS